MIILMDAKGIADIVVGVVLIAAIMGIALLIFRKKLIWLLFGIEMAGGAVCYFLGMYFSAIVFLAFFIVTAVLAGSINVGEVRSYLANPVTIQAKEAQAKSVKDMDRAKLNKSITQAVKWLADNRVGAIITFERGVSLEKYMASGTMLNAPVTPELIETVFFEGTRLHDGAMIIRGNTIIAASVFFPTTTKTLVGKYGARHRAALGISEITDSVTIVVSEETGRISVAYSGVLEPIKYDEFEKVFQTFMLTPSGTSSEPLFSKGK